MNGIMDDLGQLIDQAYNLRQRRLNISKEVKDLQDEENEILNTVKRRLEELGLTQGRGNIASLSLKPDMFPAVKDKQAFYNWAVENGHFELLMAQVNKAAFKEYFELNQAFPIGTDAHTDSKISLVKVG